jgi:ferric-dicitrate binding protein FerR (iron transport regulator)
MHFENNIPDYELLAKYLAGEASSEEKSSVETWINAGNQKEFSKIKAVWIASDSASKVFDVDSALNKVNLKIKESDSSKKRSLYRIIGAIAAILMIIAIPLLQLNNKSGNSENKMISFASEDSIAKISLDDGSNLTLNSNSSIEYSNDFKNNRRIKLSGEAYFEVAHIDNQNKFIVEAKDFEITVVGTKFNVTAIENSDIIEVSVTEGIVTVRQKDSDDFIEIYKDEKVSFNCVTKEITKSNSTCENDIFWITKKIVFKNAQISEVASTLSSVYGIDVVIGLTDTDSLRLNTSFENNSLEEVIKILELTLDIKINKTGNSITFNDAE